MSAPLADSTTDKGFRLYQAKRRDFWNGLATRSAKPAASRYYHRRLAEIYRFLIPPGSRVIELGSGSGDLLAALQPSRGLGIDFAEEAVAQARISHPELEFRCVDVHELDLDERFDVIVLSDLVNDIWDVESVLRKLADLCTPETRVIINSFNRLWQGPIALSRALHLTAPVLKQNWLSRQDLLNLLRIAGLEPISTAGEILWPVRTPIVDASFNKFLVKLWPFNHMALTHFVIAKSATSRAGDEAAELSVS
ncbi:MAG: class I SAM-dependent methyltransferase, partial [Acidimicrobiia bacterium]